jgi:hypothetical protein
MAKKTKSNKKRGGLIAGPTLGNPIGGASLGSGLATVGAGAATLSSSGGASGLAAGGAGGLAASAGAVSGGLAAGAGSIGIGGILFGIIKVIFGIILLGYLSVGIFTFYIGYNLLNVILKGQDWFLKNVFKKILKLLSVGKNIKFNNPKNVWQLL